MTYEGQEGPKPGEVWATKLKDCFLGRSFWIIEKVEEREVTYGKRYADSYVIYWTRVGEEEDSPSSSIPKHYFHDTFQRIDTSEKFNKVFEIPQPGTLWRLTVKSFRFMETGQICFVFSSRKAGGIEGENGFYCIKILIGESEHEITTLPREWWRVFKRVDQQ